MSREDSDPGIKILMTKIKSAFATYMVVCIASSYGFLFIISVFLEKPIYLIQPYFGLDYHEFFQAARDVINQQNPYLHEYRNFVTPPLSALISIPLVGLSEHAAATAFFFANIVLTFSAIMLAQRACNLVMTQRLSIFILLFLSAPTLMLFERGNIDGVVAFLVAGTIYFLKRPIVSGILLSAGILIKIYPLILLFPILIQRHLRVVICCTVAMSLALFALHDLFILFFSNLMLRASENRISENLSAFTFLFAIERRLLPDMPSAQIALKALYYTAIIAIFAFGVLKDIRRYSVTCPDIEMRAVMASYLVFVINVPDCVYLYSGVMIILMMIYMLDLRVVIGRYALMTLFLGSFFVFFPARSFDLTLGGRIAGEDESTRYSEIFNFLPPAGSAILLCFFIALRLEGIKAVIADAEATANAASDALREAKG
jgi:hypothetical protein